MTFSGNSDAIKIYEKTDFMNHFNSCHDITNMLLLEFCNVFVGLYFSDVSEASVGILDGKLP